MEDDDNDDGCSLKRSFGIDNGELDGLTPQQIFVLGFEACQIDDILSRDDAAEKLVHAGSADRIRRWCDEDGREYSLTYMEDDQSENWMKFTLRPK